MSKPIEAEIVEETQAVVLSEIKYPVSQIDLNTLLEEYKEIPTIDPDGDIDLVGEQYRFVERGHKAFVRARTSIEKTRKLLKQPALDYGKKVDDIAKEFQATILSTEVKLQIQRKIVEDNEARKQREAEELEEARIDNIKRVINALKNAPMECINKSAIVIREAMNLMEYPTIKTLEEYLEEAVNIYNLSQTQMKQMHDNQLLVENAQQLTDERDEENRKLKAIEDKKQQAERDLFAQQQAEFQKQKYDFARQRREQQEEIDLQNANIEADRMLREQAELKQQREQQEAIEADAKKVRDGKLLDDAVMETFAALKSHKGISEMLNAIIRGEIINVKFEIE